MGDLEQFEIVEVLTTFLQRTPEKETRKSKDRKYYLEEVLAVLTEQRPFLW